jgi:hypothetical protein
MAALSTVLAIAAITASAASTASTLMQKPPKAPKAPELPVAPDEDAASKEREETIARVKRRRAGSASAGRTSTLLTGPMGLATDAPTMRKTLLGA